MRAAWDLLSRAIKISPSVLILVSSRSKKLTPSRSPFVHVTENVCPFANCAPWVGYVTWKSGERYDEVAMKKRGWLRTTMRRKGKKGKKNEGVEERREP